MHPNLQHQILNPKYPNPKPKTLHTQVMVDWSHTEEAVTKDKMSLEFESQVLAEACLR